MMNYDWTLLGRGTHAKRCLLIHGLRVNRLGHWLVHGLVCWLVQGLSLVHAVHWLSVIVGHNDSSSSIVMRVVQLTHLKSLCDLFLFPPNYQRNNHNQRYNPTYNSSNNGPNINFIGIYGGIPIPRTPRKVVFR